MADEVRFCTVIPGSCCFQHMLAAEEGGGVRKQRQHKHWENLIRLTVLMRYVQF